MPPTSIHWTQAEHNQALALSLLVPPNHDWAITVAFYSAIHYFEAWLFYQPEQHSEVNIPAAVKSVHTRRDQLIQKYLPRATAIAFRKLRTASETSRYLSAPGGVSGSGFLTNTAFDYFSPSAAKSLVERDLADVFSKLEWWIFVERLSLSGKSAGKQLVYGKLRQNFNSQAEFRACRSDRLRLTFSQPELTILHGAITSVGVSHSEMVAALR